MSLLNHDLEYLLALCKSRSPAWAADTLETNLWETIVAEASTSDVFRLAESDFAEHARDQQPAPSPVRLSAVG